MLLTFRLLLRSLSLSHSRLCSPSVVFFRPFNSLRDAKKSSHDSFLFCASLGQCSELYSVEPNQTRLFTSPRKKIKSARYFREFLHKSECTIARSHSLASILIVVASLSHIPRNSPAIVNALYTTNECFSLLLLLPSTLEPSSNIWRATTSYN